MVSKLQNKRIRHPVTIELRTDIQAFIALRLPNLSTKSKKALIEAVIEGGDAEKASKLLLDKVCASLGSKTAGQMELQDRLLVVLLTARKPRFLIQILGEVRHGPRRAEAVNHIQKTSQCCYKALISDVFLWIPERAAFVEKACEWMNETQCGHVLSAHNLPGVKETYNQLTHPQRLHIVKRLCRGKLGGVALWALRGSGNHFPEKNPPTATERALLIEQIKKIDLFAHSLLCEKPDNEAELTKDEMLALLPQAVEYGCKTRHAAYDLLNGRAATLLTHEQKTLLKSSAAKAA